MAIFVDQLYISKDSENSKKQYLSGKVTITDDQGDPYTELQQINVLPVSNIKHIAIQGESGLRFSFNQLLGQTLIDEYIEDNENDAEIERIISEQGNILSTFGLYELDITDFNLSINNLYLYLPEGKNELSQDIIIDYMYEGGTVNG